MTFIKKVSFLEADCFSAWPKRLVGLVDWKKEERNTNDILSEYNNFWYKKALDLWKNFFYKDKSVRPCRFFRMLDNIIRDEIIQNFEVYGVSKDEHLVSVNRELFVANWSIVTAFYDNLLTDIIEQYSDKYKAFTLVELGCGSGNNLFKLYEKLTIDSLVGGEICNNAIELGNAILKHCGISGSFDYFDYYQENDLFNLTKNIKDKYILFTSHSIEQIKFEKTNLIEQILQLDHRPEVVIHFEPIIDHEDNSFVNQLHQSYAERNLYNSDFFEVILNYEKTGIIKIIDVKKDVFGMSAFNPTSVLTWKCL